MKPIKLDLLNHFIKHVQFRPMELFLKYFNLPKLFCTILVCCYYFIGQAQVQTHVVGDSVRVHGNNNAGELILENSTKNVNGFLFNRDNGRTEFRRGINQVNDTLYVIGADTLRIAHLININTVYYVSKKYAGAAAAVFTGKTQSSISSSNSGYTQQLAKAVPGSMLFPYPDPFSARNAALDAINSGKISSATIVVMAGNSYTVGSDNPAQNGDLNYNANANVAADVGFSNANSTDVASLCQDKVHYFFEKDAQLHYINSSYTVWMTYLVDASDPNWESGIYGHGYFRQYYGQKQGFSSGWCQIDNANAQFEFRSDYLELQYWRGFLLPNISRFHIDIKHIQAGYVNILQTIVSRNGNGKPMTGYFNCDNFIYGQGRILNDYNDFWSAFSLGTSNASVDTSYREKNITIQLKNADIRVGLPEYDAFIMSNGFTNANISVQIANLKQTSTSIAWASSFASLIGCTFSRNNNVLMNVAIQNAETEYPLFGMLKNSYADPARFSRFNFYCGLHRKLPSAVMTDEWAKRNLNIQNDYLTNVVKAKLTISGNYINESNSEVLAMDYTNVSKQLELKGYFKTTALGKNVMIFNGYQDKRIALTDATLVNDGVTPCIALKGSQNGYGTSGGVPLNTARTLYIKNVHANASPDAGVLTVGDSIKVTPDLVEYY